MADIVYCEWMKLKRSKIMLTGVLGSFIVPFLVAVNHIRISLSDPSADLSMGGIYEDSIMFIMLLFGPLVMAVVATWLVSREYTEKTLKTIFAVPIGRGRFLAGKFIMLFLLVLLFMLLSWADIIVVSLFCNLFFKVSQITFVSAVYFLIRMVKGGLLLSATLTPFIWLALRTKGTFAPFVVIAALSLLNVVLSGSPIAGIYPWTAAYLLVTGRTAEMGSTVFVGRMVILFLCLTGIGLSIWEFQKEDIG